MPHWITVLPDYCLQTAGIPLLFCFGYHTAPHPLPRPVVVFSFYHPVALRGYLVRDVYPLPGFLDVCVPVTRLPPYRFYGTRWYWLDRCSFTTLIGGSQFPFPQLPAAVTVDTAYPTILRSCTVPRSSPANWNPTLLPLVLCAPHLFTALRTVHTFTPRLPTTFPTLLTPPVVISRVAGPGAPAHGTLLIGYPVVLRGLQIVPTRCWTPLPTVNDYYRLARFCYRVGPGLPDSPHH